MYFTLQRGQKVLPWMERELTLSATVQVHFSASPKSTKVRHSFYSLDASLILYLAAAKTYNFVRSPMWLVPHVFSTGGEPQIKCPLLHLPVALPLVADCRTYRLEGKLKTMERRTENLF